MSDQNRPVLNLKATAPPSAGRDRAKRIAFRGARFVALAALALCATTGAAALLSFWLFASGRPLLRELYCP